MRIYLKITTVFAVFFLLIGIAACKGSAPTPKPTSTKTDSGPVNTVHDFKGRTFRISGGMLHDGNAWKTDSVEDIRMRERADFLREQCNGDYNFVGDGTYSTDESVVIPSMVAGNPVCDLTNLVPFSMHRFLSKNCIVPIEEYAEDTEMNNPDLWDQASQDMFSIKGQRYAFVTRYSEEVLVGQTKVLFFNKTLLTASGVSDNLYELQANKQWTWDKFSEISAKITKDKDGDGDTDIWGTGGNGYSLLLGFVVSNGGNMFANNEQGLPDIMFDKQPAKEAFQFLVDLTTKKKAMRPRPIEEGGAIDFQLFTKGYMGFTSEYSNRVIPEIHAGLSNMKNDFGILLFPLAPNKSDYKMPYDYYQGWSVVSNISDPQDVAEFISFFFRPAMTHEETAANFDVRFSDSLRDAESLETLRMITWDKMVIDAAGAYIVGGTDADATFLIIDGTEPVYLGEMTVQQYYDENMPILKDRLQKTWKGILE